MPDYKPIENITGVARNVDIEEISDEFAYILQNLKPRHGKLIKTKGFGELYSIEGLNSLLNDEYWDDDYYWDDDKYWVDGDVQDDAGENVQSIVTFVHEKFANGYKYIAYIVNSNNIVTLKVWDEVNLQWKGIGDIIQNAAYTHTYYHKQAKNPIISENDMLRFLPGNVGEINEHEAKGIWLGYIDRTLCDKKIKTGEAEPDFDGITYDRGFYLYDTCLKKPYLEDLNIEKHLIKGGNYSAGEDDDGLIDADEIDTRYYKFAYIYDGIQEGPLSDIIKVDFNLATDVFLQMGFTINFTAMNKRITGIAVYRAELPTSTFYKIDTIDFLRKDEDAEIDLGTIKNGRNWIYIPELENFTFLGGRPYWIEMYHEETDDWKYVYITSQEGSLSGSGHKWFQSDDNTLQKYTFFNAPWRVYVKDPGVAARKCYGKNFGGYAGNKVIFTDNDTDTLENLIGGVLSFDVETSLDIINIWEDTKGIKCQVTKWPSATYVYSDHATRVGLDVGDIVRLHGFEENEYYNGYYEILEKDGENKIVVGVPYGTDEDGYCYAGRPFRIIGNVDNQAILLEKPIIAKEISNAKAITPKGGYYKFNAYNITEEIFDELPEWMEEIFDNIFENFEEFYGIHIWFYDNNLTNGEEHPYQGEPSLKMNGQHAKVIKNRLVLGDIVIDPGDKNEERKSWIGFSEEGKFDTFPASNVKIMQDDRGGPITGLTKSLSSLLVLKKHSFLRLDMPDIEDPATWYSIEAPTNRGNISINGYIEVGDFTAIISHDGIYLINSNMAAASDETPLIKSRITEPINNIFMALTNTEKENIISFYDQLYTEIVFVFGTDNIWAYDILEQRWRSITTAVDLTVNCIDRSGNVLVYDNTLAGLYDSNNDESVIAKLKTKRYRLSNLRKEVLRALRIRYLSGADLSVNVYPLDATTKTKTLETNADLSVATIGLRSRCKAYQLEITEDEASTEDIEIHGLEQEVN